MDQNNLIASYENILFSNRFLQNQVVELQKMDATLKHKLALYEVGIETISKILKTKSEFSSEANRNNETHRQECLHRISQVLIHIESLLNDKRKRKSKSTNSNDNFQQPHFQNQNEFESLGNSAIFSKIQQQQHQQETQNLEKYETVIIRRRNILDANGNQLANAFDSHADVNTISIQPPVLVITKIKNDFKECKISTESSNKSSSAEKFEKLMQSVKTPAKPKSLGNFSDSKTTMRFVEILKEQMLIESQKTMKNEEKDQKAKNKRKNTQPEQQISKSNKKVKMTKRESFSIDSLLESKFAKAEDVQLIKKSLNALNFATNDEAKKAKESEAEVQIIDEIKPQSTNFRNAQIH